MLAATLSMSAQTEGNFLSKVTFRPTIGLNISSVSYSGGASDALVSFKAGALADYAFKKDWGFRSGLLLTGQGGKHGSDYGSGSVSWSYRVSENPWYLEIPLDVYYDFGIGDVTLGGFTGFPLEIGLFGNHTIKDGGYGTGHVSKETRSAFKDFSRFALAWNIGVEATWRKITLGLEYNRHLSNDGKGGNKCHLQTFSINLGYTL